MCSSKAPLSCVETDARSSARLPAWCYFNQVEVGSAIAASFAKGFIKREDLFVTTKVGRFLTLRAPGLLTFLVEHVRNMIYRVDNLGGSYAYFHTCNASRFFVPEMCLQQMLGQGFIITFFLAMCRCCPLHGYVACSQCSDASCTRSFVDYPRLMIKAGEIICLVHVRGRAERT